MDLIQNLNPNSGLRKFSTQACVYKMNLEVVFTIKMTMLSIFFFYTARFDIDSSVSINTTTTKSGDLFFFFFFTTLFLLYDFSGSRFFFLLASTTYPPTYIRGYHSKKRHEKCICLSNVQRLQIPRQTFSPMQPLILDAAADKLSVRQQQWRCCLAENHTTPLYRYHVVGACPIFRCLPFPTLFLFYLC